MSQDPSFIDSSRTGTHTTIGVDVGGTKILAALVAFHDGIPEVVEEHVVPSAAGSPEVVENIIAAVEAFGPGLGGAHAVGVGMAGFVGRDGVIVRAPNARGLEGRDVRSRLVDRFGLPVTVDNDANCAAAAARVVLAPGCDSLVAVTLGTGIGGGIILGGRLLRGAHGFAGEPGHMVVDPEGPPCPCGQRGCWERYASGRGLAHLAREAVLAGRADSVLAAAGGEIDSVRGEHVTMLVDADDAAAEAILDRWAWWVALGVANLVNLLDPEWVVIGGGLVAEGERLLDRIRGHLGAFPAAARTPGRSIRLVATPGGPTAGALGAAVLAAAELDGPDGSAESGSGPTAAGR